MLLIFDGSIVGFGVYQLSETRPGLVYLYLSCIGHAEDDKFREAGACCLLL